MARIIEIANSDDPALDCYARLTDNQLRNRLRPEEGLIIVESPKVIRVALSQGLQPVSMLCERRHIEGDASALIASCPAEMPVYTADRNILATLTGYTLTRGVLCAMRRPSPQLLGEILRDAKRICIIDGVCDTTNIGAIFRSAAALGIDVVLLTPDSCDPLNRRAVRVSMGSVFLVPWCRINAIDDVKTYGFKTVAMALRADSCRLDDPRLHSEPRLAIVLGTEGDGLANDVIDSADFTVCIPMRHDVDSLNVAAASAVAFYALVD